MILIITKKSIFIFSLYHINIIIMLNYILSLSSTIIGLYIVKRQSYIDENRILVIKFGFASLFFFGASIGLLYI